MSTAPSSEKLQESHHMLFAQGRDAVFDLVKSEYESGYALVSIAPVYNSRGTYMVITQIRDDNAYQHRKEYEDSNGWNNIGAPAISPEVAAKLKALHSAFSETANAKFNDGVFDQLVVEYLKSCGGLR